MSKLFGLPPMTPELKSITPYLQRADELKTSEPVMAYWCAYYAAQVGISLKARDTPSRLLLASLLTNLEALKESIGPNDAVDIESASAAFVENFALKVFAMADNEDRRGASTRSTAKKFLAAANFLEVLKTFPTSEVSDSAEEKIRYAKWKAADIAKAYREGRRPTPGAAGEALNPSSPTLSIPPASPTTPSSFAFEPVPGAPKVTPRISPPLAPSSGPTKRVSPPPTMGAGDVFHANASAPVTPPRGGRYPGMNDAGTPESWSTVATPGSVAGGDSRSPIDGKAYALGGSKLKNAWANGQMEGQLDEEKEFGNGNANAAALGIPSGKKSVHFTPSVTGGLSSTAGSPPTTPSYESLHHPRVEPTHAPLPDSSGSEASPPLSDGSQRSQHRPRRQSQSSPPSSGKAIRTSPTTGITGLPSAGTPLVPSLPTSTSATYPSGSSGSPPTGYGAASRGPAVSPTLKPSAPPSSASAAGPHPSAPPFYPPNIATPPHMVSPPNAVSPAQAISPPHVAPPPNVVSPSHAVSPPSSANQSQYFVPPPPGNHSQHMPPPSATPQGLSTPRTPVTPQLPGISQAVSQQPVISQPAESTDPPAAELTPALIAKAQKHCRFAISALDYEDAAQARKELRAALAVLGE